MGILLAKFREVFVFIEDFLKVTKETEHDRIDKVRDILKTLDAVKLQLKAAKYNIAIQEIEWLGLRKTGQGISPVNSKLQGKMETLRPTNLKKLRSLLGAVNQLINLFPIFRQIVFPLKQDALRVLTEEQKRAFSKVDQEIKNVAQLTHFKRNKPSRIISGAKKQGLGAVLEHWDENKSKPIA